MAIALECINVIIPFGVIRQKYPGGLVRCPLDHRGSIGGKGPIWFDEHLFRDGAWTTGRSRSFFHDGRGLGSNPRWSARSRWSGETAAFRRWWSIRAV